MFAAHLFPATRASELQWVWRASAGFIIVVRKRKTWRQIAQPRESYECTQRGQHWNRICLLNESQVCFFSALLPCVEFDCSGGRSFPPSTVCSVQAWCVCLAVWLRLAVLVWECQWLSVCHAVRRIRSECSLGSRKSSETGRGTTARVRYRTTILFAAELLRQ